MRGADGGGVENCWGGTERRGGRGHFGWKKKKGKEHGCDGSAAVLVPKERCADSGLEKPCEYSCLAAFGELDFDGVPRKDY